MLYTDTNRIEDSVQQKHHLAVTTTLVLQLQRFDAGDDAA